MAEFAVLCVQVQVRGNDSWEDQPMLVVIEELTGAVDEVVDQVASATDLLKEVVEDLPDEFRKKWGAQLEHELDELRGSQARLDNLLAQIAAEA